MDTTDTRRQPDERESDPGFLVLVGLADGPKDVDVMIEAIERTAGARLGPSALYGAIARLAQRGLIEPLATNHPRQPYWLTDAGAEIARSKFMRLAELANARWFVTWKTRWKTALQPGEQLQDPVRGSYEDHPYYTSAAARDHISPQDR